MLLAMVELLQARGRFAPAHSSSGPHAASPAMAWGAIVTLVCTGGALYGASMGSFEARPLQMAFSALKVPMLLAISVLICLPNFYAVNAVLGLREDFAAAIRAVLAAQATVAVTLASLAPVVLLAYFSTTNYPLCILINGAHFAVAALAGQRTLSLRYAPLVARDSRHRWARSAWLALYVFVAIQMAWVLRPFVGDPGQPTRFFREHAWSNAYVVVVRDVLRVLSVER